MCVGLTAAEDADKATATEVLNDELRPPTSETAEDLSSESDRPQEASANIADTGPMEAADADAVTAATTGANDSAEEVSAGAAMDTDATAGAAASTDKHPSELPFQVQITYTDLDGAEAVRVLTQTQPVTRDRHQAETSMSLSLSPFHSNWGMYF